MILTSKVGKVTVGTDIVSNAANFTMTSNSDALETTGIGDSVRTYLQGLDGFTVTISYEYDSANTAQGALRTASLPGGNKAIASLKLYENATKYFDCAVLLTSYAVTKGVGAIDTVSVSFQGTGTPTYN